MSLQNEIQALMGELGKKVPAEMMDKVGAFIGRLASEGVAKSARKAGDTAPGFALRNVSGRTVALADLLAKGPVVVSFFRGEWCPFCDLELRALQKTLPEFAARGASLVAISPQLAENNRSTAESRSLGFEVLSDPGNATAKAFGIAFSMNAAEQDLHKAFGADLPAVNGAANWDLPVPATFVIDAAGRIAWAHVDSNYTARAEPAEILAAVSAARRAD
jgi:peroxiredoxin